MKLTSKIQIKNQQGIHTRPATQIVKLLYGVSSSVFFTHNGTTIDAKSILSILMLALHKDDLITVTVEGDDAESVLCSLQNGFENCFGDN